MNIDAVTHTSTTPGTGRRRPWLAGLLTILTPGLGHLYIGQPGRGISLLLTLWTAIAVWVLLSMHIPIPAVRISSFLLVLGVYAWIAFDAIRWARRTTADYPLRRYNRSWVYAAVVLFFAFVLQPAFAGMVKATLGYAYTFPSGMMSPTLQAGDYLYAVPRAPSPIRRGSLVVWRDTTDGEYIQRVLGMPGDTVEMRAKTLYVNGEPVREAYVQHIDPLGNPSDSAMLWQRAYLLPGAPAQYRPSRDSWGPLAVPAGNYLLLGDNRDNSFDGRYRGVVPHSWITGRPIWIYLSRDPQSGQFRWDRVGRNID